MKDSKLAIGVLFAIGLFSSFAYWLDGNYQLVFAMILDSRDPYSTVDSFVLGIYILVHTLMLSIIITFCIVLFFCKLSTGGRLVGTVMTSVCLFIILVCVFTILFRNFSEDYYWYMVISSLGQVVIKTFGAAAILTFASIFTAYTKENKQLPLSSSLGVPYGQPMSQQSMPIQPYQQYPQMSQPFTPQAYPQQSMQFNPQQTYNPQAYQSYQQPQEQQQQEQKPHSKSAKEE